MPGGIFHSGSLSFTEQMDHLIGTPLGQRLLLRRSPPLLISRKVRSEDDMIQFAGNSSRRVLLVVSCAGYVYGVVPTMSTGGRGEIALKRAVEIEPAGRDLLVSPLPAASDRCIGNATPPRTRIGVSVCGRFGV